MTYRDTGMNTGMNTGMDTNTGMDLGRDSDLDLDTRESVPGTVIGGLAFAASMMIMLGSFSIVAGLGALLDDDYLIPHRRYAFDLSTGAWGWIHVALGLALVLAGFGLFANKAWADIVAIVLAGLTAIDFFFFVPYQPVWSVVIIALSIWVIWAVIRARHVERADF